MKRIEAIVRTERVGSVVVALREAGVCQLTVSRGRERFARGEIDEAELTAGMSTLRSSRGT